MEAANTRPWERDYTIKQTLVLAETPKLRIIDLTLAPGECVPWHLHPDNDDRGERVAGGVPVPDRAGAREVRR